MWDRGSCLWLMTTRESIDVFRPGRYHGSEESFPFRLQNLHLDLTRDLGFRWYRPGGDPRRGLCLDVGLIILSGCRNIVVECMAHKEGRCILVDIDQFRTSQICSRCGTQMSEVLNEESRVIYSRLQCPTCFTVQNRMPDDLMIFAKEFLGGGRRMLVRTHKDDAVKDFIIPDRWATMESFVDQLQVRLAVVKENQMSVEPAFPSSSSLLCPALD